MFICLADGCCKFIILLVLRLQIWKEEMELIHLRNVKLAEEIDRWRFSLAPCRPDGRGCKGGEKGCLEYDPMNSYSAEWRNRIMRWWHQAWPPPPIHVYFVPCGVTECGSSTLNKEVEFVVTLYCYIFGAFVYQYHRPCDACRGCFFLVNFFLLSHKEKGRTAYKLLYRKKM